PQWEEGHRQAEGGNPLQSEFGWHDVGKGLTRILVSYFMLVLGIAIGVGLVLIAVFGQELEIIDKGKNARNQIELLVLLGVGIAVISSLVSYGFLITGKLRCLMNAPERCAAKWLMFCCILCLATGPALNILSSLTGEGAQNIKELRKGGKQGIAQLEFKG